MENKPVFQICLSRRQVGDSDAYACLALPASYYELQDAIERAHLNGSAGMLVEITDYTSFPFLAPYLEEWQDLYALNALAEKLAALESWQIAALEGLVLMEEQKSVPFGLPRIYDLAAGAKEGACQVLFNVCSDAELGDFYACNDLAPEIENLPDTVYELLDYARIGQRIRTGEGGVFLRNRVGYVTQVCELPEVFQTLELPPKAPDYAVLLAVGVPDADPSLRLKLPCAKEELASVPKQLGECGWSALAWRCCDCRIPALCDMITVADDVSFVDLVARTLWELPEESIPECKAIVEAVQPKDLEEAIKQLDCRDDYLFYPELNTPEKIGRDELETLMGKNDLERLLSHVDLHTYGKELLELHHRMMTPYGMIQRFDGQPILSAQHQQRRKEGCHVEQEMG